MSRINNLDKISFSICKFLKNNFGSCLSWAVTFAWLIFIFLKIKDGELPTDLNAFGDFIAGAFAPLAFFWLVRGFYQQGKGLEQNSDALRIQALELQSSTQALNDQVVEQRNLLVATKDEIEIIKEKNNYEKLIEHKKSQPFFHIFNPMGKLLETQNSYDSDPCFYVSVRFTFSNTRAICRELSIHIETPYGNTHYHPNFAVIFNDQNKFYEFELMGEILKTEFHKDEYYAPLRVEFTFLDALDNWQNINMNFRAYEYDNNVLKFAVDKLFE